MRWYSLVLVAAVAAVGCRQPAAAVRPSAPVAPLGASSAPGTSRAALAETVQRMEGRLRTTPTDVTAAIHLADALLRQARVLGNPGLAVRAERALLPVLAADPDRYDARRMLATVLLSQHRFRDAIREAERCLQMRRDAAWPHGVIGDARLELGEYQQAFEAFDRMMAVRPDAASYARMAYAAELQGDLDDAARLMAMALEATSPNDPEALAWHHGQLGELHMAGGRLADAAREFAHAEFIFPGHPFAAEGRARVAHARGQHREALAETDRLIAHTPTPWLLKFAADQLRALGRAAEAERRDAQAEAAWRTDAPDPVQLALFLAQRGHKLDEAVRLAEAASRERDDIFTADALAWAYFRSGRLDDAVRTSGRALRTGTRDREIRERARAIARAAAAASTQGAR